MGNLDLYVIGATLMIFMIIQIVIGIMNFYRNADLDDPQHKLERKKVYVMRLDVWIIFLMVFFYCDFGWEANLGAMVGFCIVGYIQITLIGHNN